MIVDGETELSDQLRYRATPEQYRSFGEYVCTAHSWHKGPLLDGWRFVVFISRDAGTRGFPDLAEFTAAHTPVCHGWKTTQEYRDRFCYLDYMWQRPTGHYSRDGCPAIELSQDIVRRCGFTLFPYVSWREPDYVTTWQVGRTGRVYLDAHIVSEYLARHEEAVAELKTGAEHPERESVLELAELAAALSTAHELVPLQELDKLWEAHVKYRRDTPIPHEPSPALQAYAGLAESAQAIFMRLVTKEKQKIVNALEELDKWLAEGDYPMPNHS